MRLFLEKELNQEKFGCNHDKRVNLSIITHHFKMSSVPNGKLSGSSSWSDRN